VTSKNLNVIANFVGESPNEIWMRTGQVVAILSIGSMLGLSVTGITTSVTTEYAPYVGLLFGGFCMYYGARLRKNSQIAKRNHELAMMEGLLQPSTRMQKFCAQVLKSPKNKTDISESEFEMYDKMPKASLLMVLKQSTANECLGSGIAGLTSDGEYYDTRTDTTVIN